MVTYHTIFKNLTTLPPWGLFWSSCSWTYVTSNAQVRVFTSMCLLVNLHLETIAPNCLPNEFFPLNSCSLTFGWMGNYVVHASVHRKRHTIHFVFTCHLGWFKIVQKHIVCYLGIEPMILSLTVPCCTTYSSYRNNYNVLGKYMCLTKTLKIYLKDLMLT